MKAVVMEVKDGYAAVLSEDGQFIKVKDNGYTLGMELTLEKKSETKEKKDSGKIINFKSRRIWRSVAAVAAALIVVIGIKDFNTPYGVISVDVNPSIEISINRYNMVLSVEAVNDDADEIVEELNTDGIKYKSVDDAVDMAISTLADGDYSADDGTTYVMISANSKSESHSDKIVKKLEKRCSTHEEISAQVITADDELVERAKEHDTTAGKMYLVESLKDVSNTEDFDESDWLKKPVKDIMYEIDSKEKPEGDQAPEKPEDDQAPEKLEDDQVPENPEDDQAPEKPEDNPIPIEPEDNPVPIEPEDNPIPQQTEDGNVPEKPEDENINETGLVKPKAITNEPDFARVGDTE